MLILIKTATKVTLAAVVALSLAGCKDDKAASCTKEQVMEKAKAVTAKIQENPASAQSVMGEVQEMATKMQGLSSGGEPSDEMLAELCKSYDSMLEKLK